MFFYNNNGENMKNRGFTLVELLGVITLLGLLALAAFELLDSVNKGNKEKAEAIQIDSILASAIAYVPTSDVKLPEKSGNAIDTLTGGYDLYTVENGIPVKKLSSGVPVEKVCFSLEYLYSEGIIEDNIISPMTGEPYENPLVCVLLISPTTKTDIEKELENLEFTWNYDGTYLYYFDTGDRAINILG